MDETQESKPHVHVVGAAHAPREDEPGSPAARGEALSIWFFCGILTLVYGAVLIVEGIIEYNHPPPNELLLPLLIPLHPTLWWGTSMFLFGAFYTIRFRPGRR